MQKLLPLLVLLFSLVATATATDITVPTVTLPNFQVQNIGNPTTGTASVTTGSATVTSSAAFPARLVGLGGYKVLLGGFEYEVLSTESTSSLTLSSVYAGSTGSAGFTIYPVVLLQVYSDTAYFPNGKTYSVQAGNRTQATGFYKRVACSFKYFSGVPSLVIPQITLDAISDAPNNAEKNARLSIHFFRVDGGYLRPYDNFESFTVMSSPTTQQWSDINRYNKPLARAFPDSATLTRSQIYDLINSTNPNISGTYRRIGMISSSGTGVENSALLQDGSGNLATSGAFTATGNIDTAGTLNGGIPTTTYAAAQAAVGPFVTGTRRWLTDDYRGPLISVAGYWVREYDYINVRWFGALGNDDNNDTEELNAAAVKAEELGLSLYSPGGTYKLLDTFTSTVSVSSQGWGKGLRFKGDGARRTVFKAYFNNKPVVSLKGYSPSGGTGDLGNGDIGQFGVIQNSGQTGVTGLRLQGIAYSTVHDIITVGLSGNGIELYASGGTGDSDLISLTTFQRILSYSNTGSGFAVNSPSAQLAVAQVKFIECFAQSNQVDGFYLQNFNGIELDKVVSVVNDGADSSGVRVAHNGNYPRDLVLRGCEIGNGNTRAGLRLDKIVSVNLDQNRWPCNDGEAGNVAIEVQSGGDVRGFKSFFDQFQVGTSKTSYTYFKFDGDVSSSIIEHPVFLNAIVSGQTVVSDLSKSELIVNNSTSGKKGHTIETFSTGTPGTITPSWTAPLTIIDLTGAGAYTIANPTGGTPPAGQVKYFSLRNLSGGVVTLSWGSEYEMRHISAPGASGNERWGVALIYNANSAQWVQLSSFPARTIAPGRLPFTDAGGVLMGTGNGLLDSSGNAVFAGTFTAGTTSTGVAKHYFYSNTAALTGFRFEGISSQIIGGLNGLSENYYSANQHFIRSGSGLVNWLTIDGTAASAATGISLVSAASGSGVAINATGGTNETITISGKGTGIAALGSTSTATASGGAATLNTQRGVITTESLTTAAGASYTLTLTNSKITTSSLVIPKFSNGTNTQGTLVQGEVTEGSGSVTIIIRNIHASQALNGTIKIGFLVQ